MANNNNKIARTSKQAFAKHQHYRQDELNGLQAKQIYFSN